MRPRVLERSESCVGKVVAEHDHITLNGIIEALFMAMYQTYCIQWLTEHEMQHSTTFSHRVSQPRAPKRDSPPSKMCRGPKWHEDSFAVFACVLRASLRNCV